MAFDSTPEGASPGLRHQQVSVGDTQLHVVEAGDPGGPPFVFLHGWPEASHTWAPLMEVAAEHVRAIAIDLPGIGQSTTTTDGSSGDIRAYVEGLRGAGVTHVEDGVVAGAGHFTQEESPEETWRLIANFARAFS